MNRIICAKWGDYQDNTITQLFNNVKEKSSVPFTFECFTEFSDEFNKYQYQRDHCHHWDQGGLPHANKLQLFKLDEKFDKEDKILYLDLDVTITDDIGYFFELPNEKPYIIYNHWWEEQNDDWKRQYNIAHCPLYNSSVMLWKPGQNKPIYSFVKENTDKIFFTYRGIDTFMFHAFGPYCTKPRADHFNYFDDGIITSERLHGEATGIIHSYEGIEKNAI